MKTGLFHFLRKKEAEDSALHSPLDVLQLLMQKDKEGRV